MSAQHFPGMVLMDAGAGGWVGGPALGECGNDRHSMNCILFKKFKYTWCTIFCKLQVYSY